MDINSITRAYTAFSSLSEMAEAPDYTPSIYPHRYASGPEIAEYAALANAYDAAMESHGDNRRAYRGSRNFWIVERRNPALMDSIRALRKLWTKPHDTI